jgi:hypothetical protein
MDCQRCLAYAGHSRDRHKPGAAGRLSEPGQLLKFPTATDKPPCVYGELRGDRPISTLGLGRDGGPSGRSCPDCGVGKQLRRLAEDAAEELL